MNAAGLIRVIEFSTGEKSVYADVVAAPSALRAELKGAVIREVDIDAHEAGDVIGQATFWDVMGDPSFDYTLNGQALTL